MMSLRKGWSTRNVWPILSFANFVNILLKYTFNLFSNKFSSFVVLSSFYLYIYTNIYVYIHTQIYIYIYIYTHKYIYYIYSRIKEKQKRHQLSNVTNVVYISAL